jgi:EAL domain-containing protein (putative c-di-GMP-specific phosphodiesterase class I)
MKKRYDDFKDGVEVVKIDKDFFRYAVENWHIAELQWMYKILKLDGKKIVTEWVETDKHMKIAQELWSDYLQWYHELLWKPEEIPKDPLGIAA